MLFMAGTFGQGPIYWWPGVIVTHTGQRSNSAWCSELRLSPGGMGCQRAWHSQMVAPVEFLYARVSSSCSVGIARVVGLPTAIVVGWRVCLQPTDVFLDVLQVFFSERSMGDVTSLMECK